MLRIEIRRHVHFIDLRERQVSTCRNLRGDGEKGDDVTDNVKQSAPYHWFLHGNNYPEHFEIRGEILMPWEVFEELNREKEAREEPLFANPRNAASGTLNCKTPLL